MSAPTPRPPADIGVIIALTWAMIAIAVTALYWENLGLRGWIWLGVHHVACGIGCAHELWRGRQRHKARLLATAGSPPSGN
jgi:hypothetical protein